MSYLIFFLSLFVLVFSLRYHWWRLPITYNMPRVLMYHSTSTHGNNRKKNKWRVKPEDFERQMAWFSKNGWQSFTVSELIDQHSFPPKSFCLTFDDGFEDNYKLALPILEKYQFKATIYLVTDYPTNSWEGYADEKYVSLLSNKQISDMLATEKIEFGSHTQTHCNLTTVSDDQAKKEIIDSKKLIETKIGRRCKTFAYPYGKYNSKIIKWVEQAGYDAAITVDRGFYKKGTPFTIKRVGILGTESFFDFYLKVTRIRNKI